MTKLAKIEKLQPLTRDELRWLKSNERVIEAGKRSFMEVGHALEEIRDNRLYRAHYRTFDAYLAKRWGFSRAYASKVISGARTASVLSTKVDKMNVEPTTETQVRPLKALPESKRKEAWNRAVAKAGNCVPSERTVREVVIEMQPAKVSTKVDIRLPLQRALTALRSISSPTQNISAAIDLLTRELDGGAVNKTTKALI